MAISVILSLKKAFLIKPHKAGWPFIGGGLALTVLLFAFTGVWGLLPLFFTVFCLYFFRDPQRVTPQRPNLIVSPADGVVSSIVENIGLPAEIATGDDRSYTRVSIFLSVLDVHVNRLPVSGQVMRKVYRPGKFLNADLDKASEDNERCSVIIKTSEGHDIGMTQIAGLIARRIVNDLSEGQIVTGGARYGIIRFGSRVDIYLPQGIAPLVCTGQRAIGGETIIADSGSTEPARMGMVV